MRDIYYFLVFSICLAPCVVNAESISIELTEFKGSYVAGEGPVFVYATVDASDVEGQIVAASIKITGTAVDGTMGSYCDGWPPDVRSAPAFVDIRVGDGCAAGMTEGQWYVRSLLVEGGFELVLPFAWYSAYPPGACSPQWEFLVEGPVAFVLQTLPGVALPCAYIIDPYSMKFESVHLVLEMDTEVPVHRTTWSHLKAQYRD